MAIKVLPAEMAQDVERLARFGRAAKLLTSLNHPSIAHVYGFEGATLPDGSTVHFLAMELVLGEDLSVRPGGWSHGVILYRWHGGSSARLRTLSGRILCGWVR